MDPASHFLSLDLRWFGKQRLWGSFFLLLLLTSVYNFDFSQIIVNELTSQPHCSKCCRVLRSRDTNYSGMGFVCEPKIKRNPWWIGRTLNGKQKEGANNCWAMIHITVLTAPINNFHPSPLSVYQGPGGRESGSVESSGLSLKGGSVGRWQLNYWAVLSFLCQQQAILLCLCLRDKLQAPGLSKTVTWTTKNSVEEREMVLLFLMEVIVDHITMFKYQGKTTQMQKHLWILNHLWCCFSSIPTLNFCRMCYFSLLFSF